MTIESFVEKKTEKKNDAPSEAEELTRTLQRVQADFDNYRKRMQGESAQQYARGKAGALKELLAFADALDAAVKNETMAAPNGNNSKNGIESLRTQFHQILAQEGVKPIHTLGKTFDPFTSECLQQGADSTKEEDMVLEEFQKGYYFHSDVLRTAKVKVNKKENNDSEQTNESVNEGGKKHE